MPQNEAEVIDRQPSGGAAEESRLRGPNALVVREPDMKWLDIPRDRLRETLGGSLYPGAKPESIDMVMAYCEAAGLNVMLKPVHIVPMNVKKAGTRDSYEYRDVVMPGINHYRTQASRTGTYVGKSDPEFGPLVERSWDQFKMMVPEWCKVKVKRLVGSHVAEFTATEFWDENYATKSRDSKVPNAMWQKRPFGQIAKCTEAQALRMGFPELVGAETAEEMEGKTIDLDAVDVTPKPAAVRSLDNFAGQQKGEPEDAEVEDVEETGDAATRDGDVPDMPPDVAQLFYNPAEGKEPDWHEGWKWLNRVMPGLTDDARQRLTDEHAKLLWAVYNSDAKKKVGGKVGGPQSKAALKFAEDMGVTVPEVADD
jgi:phage recombination protein Bet